MPYFYGSCEAKEMRRSGEIGPSFKSHECRKRNPYSVCRLRRAIKRATAFPNKPRASALEDLTKAEIQKIMNL